MRWSLSVLAAGVVAACAPPAEEQQAGGTPPVDTAAAVQGVSDLWARYAVAETAGTVDALLALYTDPARLDFAGVPPVLTRATLDSLLRASHATQDYLEMHVMPASSLVLSNEMVWQYGGYHQAFAAGGTTSDDWGRYASALVRGADGLWRVTYLMAFSDSIKARR